MLSTADKALVIKHLKKWMMDKLEEDIFLILGKKLHIWVDKTDLKTSELKTQVIRLVYELLSCKNALNDVDRQRVLKRLVKMMCTKFGAEEFANEWSDWLSERKLSISSNHLKDWIVEWSRKGPVAIKQMWETFLKAHVESLMTSTRTTTQTCEIVLKSRKDKKELIDRGRTT